MSSYPVIKIQNPKLFHQLLSMFAEFCTIITMQFTPSDCTLAIDALDPTLTVFLCLTYPTGRLSWHAASRSTHHDQHTTIDCSLHVQQLIDSLAMIRASREGHIQFHIVSSDDLVVKYQKETITVQHQIPFVYREDAEDISIEEEMWVLQVLMGVKDLKQIIKECHRMDEKLRFFVDHGKFCVEARAQNRFQQYVMHQVALVLNKTGEKEPANVELFSQSYASKPLYSLLKHFSSDTVDDEELLLQFDERGIMKLQGLVGSEIGCIRVYLSPFVDAEDKF